MRRTKGSLLQTCLKERRRNFLTRAQKAASHMAEQRLTAAVRCYSEPIPPPKKKKKRRKKRRPGWRSLRLGERILVLDTETTVDFAQSLLFGAFRVYQLAGTDYQLLTEGLISDEALTKEQRSVVENYARRHGLPAHPRTSFVRDVFIREVYSAGSLCVGFNLPFDLSRLAVKWGRCRKQGWEDGFTLYLLDSKTEPPIHVKALDSKRAFIEFGSYWEFSRREQRGRRAFAGRFLDLKTLVFALTGEAHSLESACGAMGIPYKKREVRHGIVAEENLAYNREDVDATWRLYLAAAGEWNRHPFTHLPAPQVPPNSPPEAMPDLDPQAFIATRAYSPATIGKEYLRAMGIRPRREQQPDFPKDVLGYAMVAYYGGRSEVHIRRQIVPVTYLDVLSMYPTVCTLMGLWAFIIADHVEVEEATDHVQDLIERITLDDLFRPETWSDMAALIELDADSDILPIRGQYEEGGDYQIGINVVDSKLDKFLWYMLPNLVASKLLTGRVPRIRRALRFRAAGIQPGLRSVQLLGGGEVDPLRDDFFKVLIERRHEFQHAQDMAKEKGDATHERYFDSLQQGLKIIANATSYGIFAEIDEKTTGAQTADVYGLWRFKADITQEEHFGAFAFSPLAALITSAAKLMLAIAEVELVTRGASYAFADTDSMAIVGPSDVAEAVRARFATLTPYVFGGDLLKLEDENQPHPRANADPKLYCYAISAKRYVLFNVADDGSIIIRKPSEHGLGHLLSPMHDEEDKEWMKEFWAAITRWARGELKHPAESLLFSDLPALGKFPITRPTILRRFGRVGATAEPAVGKTPSPQTAKVRPFNFMLVAFPDTGDVTTGGEAYWEEKGSRKTGLPLRLKQPIRPIAPYEKDPRKWRSLRWVDLHTGRPVKLAWTPEPTYFETGTIRVQTYRDVVRRHLAHPESKSAGPDGTPCSSDTFGQLGRLSVEIIDLLHIGKESHELEEVQAQLIPPALTYVTYHDKTAEWEKDLRTLWEIPRSTISKLSGLHPRSIRAILNRRREPHPRHRRLLRGIAREWRSRRDNGHT